MIGKCQRARAQVALERVQQYKYLGIVFSATDGIAATFKSLHARLNGSWHTLAEHFGALNDEVSLALMRAMFQQCVPPAGSYACEVWGVRRVMASARERGRRWPRPTCSCGGAYFRFPRV